LVVDYLRQNFRIEICRISKWLGYDAGYLSNEVLKGKVKSITFTPRLCSLFAFSQTGGAE
jgi:hypothetical protein